MSYLCWNPEATSEHDVRKAVSTPSANVPKRAIPMDCLVTVRDELTIPQSAHQVHHLPAVPQKDL